jgi:hypothetical protein
VTYKINAQHFANISKLQAPERYDYFVKKLLIGNKDGLCKTGEDG